MRLKASGALWVWQESLAALKLLACGQAALCGVVASSQAFTAVDSPHLLDMLQARKKEVVVEGLLFISFSAYTWYTLIYYHYHRRIIFLGALNILQTHKLIVWRDSIHCRICTFYDLWAMTRLLCTVLRHVNRTEACADVICDSWPRGPALLDGALELLAGWQAALLCKPNNKQQEQGQGKKKKKENELAWCSMLSGHTHPRDLIASGESWLLWAAKAFSVVRKVEGLWKPETNINKLSSPSVPSTTCASNKISHVWLWLLISPTKLCMLLSLSVLGARPSLQVQDSHVASQQPWPPICNGSVWRISVMNSLGETVWVKFFILSVLWIGWMGGWIHSVSMGAVFLTRTPFLTARLLLLQP